jgi:membrane-bound serine protease (ClpP class)
VLVLLAILAAIFLLSSPWGLVAVSCAIVVDLAEIVFGLWYAKRRRVQTGTEALQGAIGTVVVRLDPHGQVRVAGELWQARSEKPADPGDEIRVESVGPDLILAVRPVAKGA